MSVYRSPDDRRVDTAVLLALWARCAQHPREDAGDKLRQMKLAFLASLALNEANFRGLTLTFFRWTWGPMSNEVYEAWSILKRAGMIESDEHVVLTRAGEAFARSFYDEVVRDESNTPLRVVFDSLESAWRNRPETAPLLNAVYSVCLAPEGQAEALPIRDMSNGIELIVPVDPRGAAATISVDGGWLETLALEFNPRFAADIEAGMNDFVEGRVAVA